LSNKNARKIIESNEPKYCFHGSEMLKFMYLQIYLKYGFFINSIKNIFIFYEKKTIAGFFCQIAHMRGRLSEKNAYTRGGRSAARGWHAALQRFSAAPVSNF